MRLLTAIALVMCVSAGVRAETGQIPNINTGANTVAPAQLPSTTTGDPYQPTYPAATNNPSWRGGSIGGGPNEDPTPEQSEQRRRHEANERSRAAEPSANAAPSQPEVNPGALQGGPQP